MFKLIKILNTGVNVPEIEKISCPLELSLDAGTCVSYNSNYDEIYLGNEIDAPKYVLAKDIKQGDGYALCYRISPEMVFEVPIIGEPADVSNGLMVDLAIDEDHGAYAVTDTEGGPARIYSLEGAKKPEDKILVIFDA